MPGPRRARARTFVLALVLIAGCATGHMWSTLTAPSQERSNMYYEPSKPATWVEYVGAALLLPVTIVMDIVLFPVQAIAGYWPYGDKYPP